ncbi:hypothetical protein [Micrococcus luteus]|uniref:hypothetical protein n=1 Tax=Micrococcus TaxID=1269 RepID=UPI0036F96B42|nr:hypothetical protein [Micrococcus luteus]
MSTPKRRPSIPILDGAATLSHPTAALPYWRITYRDHVTGKRKSTTGGTSREEAEAKAATLLGIYSPSAAKSATTTAPTFTETVTGWINANAHRWSSRTPSTYRYITAKYREVLGDLPINTITPAQLTAVDISHLSRERQKQVRTVMRGVFTYADAWTRAPAETYAAAINVRGTKSDDMREEVQRGDIAPLAYINNLLLCCYHTAQNGDPDALPAYSTMDELTGHKSAPERPIRRGFHTGHGDVIYRLGFPAGMIDKHKRGTPKHYKQDEDYQRSTVAEVASIFRRHGLIIALGAGAGLRIGETLALRVHHILDPATIRNLIEWSDLDDDHYTEVSQCGWTGTIRIEEQVSKDSAGFLRVSPPKMNRARVTTLPPFLPARDYSPIDYDALSAYPTEIPRTEAIEHWYTTGAAPVSMMLFDRLAEILAPIVEQYHEHGDLKTAVDAYSASLLFPTRNPPRAKTHYPSRWHGITGPDPTTKGGYIGADNLNRSLNPLYDYVSDMMTSYPAHRASRGGRKGWTYHAFRHFAASTRLMLLPATQVAAELGHQDAGFTLKRYGHAITERPTQAFRY